MGKVALFSTIGFAIIIGRMLLSSNDYVLSLSERSTEYYEKMISRNIAISGARIAMSKYFQDPAWRAGIASTSFENGDFSVTVTDSVSKVRIASTGNYHTAQKTIQVLVSVRPPLEDIAISAAGSVTNIIVLDQNGIPDTTLMIENQTLYKMDDQALIDEATTQSHVETASTFMPADDYPNPDFYHSGLIPNVTHVQGDLQVNDSRTIYGIFVVEGNVLMVGSAQIVGVLYLKSSTSIATHGHGGGGSGSIVTGGILSNGDIDGTGNHIQVTHNPEYMQKFTEYGEDTDSKLMVESWQEF